MITKDENMYTDENKYTFEMVAQMLKGYNDLKQKAMQLEFEINNYIPIATGEDIIDEMTFGKQEGDGVNFLHKGNASDKTAKIAVSYVENAKTLNLKHKKELEEDLRAANMEMLRLEYYIGLLDEKYSRVLSTLYLEGLSFAKTAESLKLSVDTVKSYRKAGVIKLVDMFNRIVR